jgi:hypothetical protein
MKIIKLNRRFKQFKENNHVIAVRFDHWNNQAQLIETTANRVLRCGGWDRKADWYSYFGTARDSRSTRPYFITFRNEADLTMVMLKADLTKIH